MNFFPIAGKCIGPALDLSAFDTDSAYTLDFNGHSKVRSAGAVIFRGAYAGSGENPGWRIGAGVKPPFPPSFKAAPVLVWVSPATLAPGRTSQVRLTGANFVPDATIALSGDGVTVTKASVLSTTAITATLRAEAGRPVGSREIVVKQASGTSNPLKLTVTSRK